MRYCQMLSYLLCLALYALLLGSPAATAQQKPLTIRSAAPREPRIDPRWKAKKFPPHAACYLTPAELKDLYSKVKRGNRPAVVSYEKPADGSLRIAGTGHSFMAPAYKTFPLIARAAGLKQPPLMTHTGGGVTGSARFKWEQENGIFMFDKKPLPKLLANIANGKWDVMLWGPYYHDRIEYYTCWIDFCLKYNPHMKFYLMDAWPQIGQLSAIPDSDKAFTTELVQKMGRAGKQKFTAVLTPLRKKYPGKVFAIPTCDAMVLAAAAFNLGELPGVEGIHKLAGGKQRSLWRDHIGHLGPGVGKLEGYVFYATLYGKSPELIQGDVPFGDRGGYPSRALDRVFRKIAWQAVINNELSGVKK